MIEKLFAVKDDKGLTYIGKSFEQNGNSITFTQYVLVPTWIVDCLQGGRKSYEEIALDLWQERKESKLENQTISSLKEDCIIPLPNF
jgi:hypothetical protein